MKTAQPSDPNKYCTCQLCSLQHPEEKIIMKWFQGIILQRCTDCENVLTKLNEK